MTALQPQFATTNPALAAKWQERRREALDAVRGLLAHGMLQAADTERVASLAHKLAGAAAMFGEHDLGARAAALETALRQSRPREEVELHARAMLAAA